MYQNNRLISCKVVSHGVELCWNYDKLHNKHHYLYNSCELQIQPKQYFLILFIKYMLKYTLAIQIGHLRHLGRLRGLVRSKIKGY